MVLKMGPKYVGAIFLCSYVQVETQGGKGTEIFSSYSLTVG